MLIIIIRGKTVEGSGTIMNDKNRTRDVAFIETTDEKVRKVFALLEHKFSDRLKLMKYCERTETYKKALEDMIPDTKIGHRTFREKGKFLSCFIVPGDSDDENERYYLYNKAKELGCKYIATGHYTKFHIFITFNTRIRSFLIFITSNKIIYNSFFKFLFIIIFKKWNL